MAILRETVVSVMIHGHVFSVTLHFGIVVDAADVLASWVGLFYVEMGRSDTQLAAGEKKQLGETGCRLQLKEGQAPLCLTWYVCECTCNHATLHA